MITTGLSMLLKHMRGENPTPPDFVKHDLEIEGIDADRIQRFLRKFMRLTTRDIGGEEVDFDNVDVGEMDDKIVVEDPIEALDEDRLKQGIIDLLKSMGVQVDDASAELVKIPKGEDPDEVVRQHIQSKQAGAGKADLRRLRVKPHKDQPPS
jgi:hypothetical protein